MSKLSRKEMEEEYPLMLKYFSHDLLGAEQLEIRRIDGPGMSGAHMVFAPLIERALERAAVGRLWEQFFFAVSVRRKKRARK